MSTTTQHHPSGGTYADDAHLALDNARLLPRYIVDEADAARPIPALVECLHDALGAFETAIDGMMVGGSEAPPATAADAFDAALEPRDFARALLAHVVGAVESADVDRFQQAALVRAALEQIEAAQHAIGRIASGQAEGARSS